MLLDPGKSMMFFSYSRFLQLFFSIGIYIIFSISIVIYIDIVKERVIVIVIT